jgi:hypothetical protein
MHMLILVLFSWVTPVASTGHGMHTAVVRNPEQLCWDL